MWIAAALLLSLSLLATPSWSQSTATLSGSVQDPDGAVIAGARVRLSNPLTGFARDVSTGESGAFTITNIPFQNYELLVEQVGFTSDRRTVVLRSNVPVQLTVLLKLEEHHQSIDVAAYGGALIEPEATGSRTELNMSAISRYPVSAGSRGLESVLASMPGFAVNANGAIHPRGAHNQMTYVIDGMPISDQLTGAFANAVDPNVVQTIELHTGNIPAEYGSKVSGVANITTRSGLGGGRPFSGSLETGVASFGTLSELLQMAGGTERFGYFTSFNAIKSNRYLDQVSRDNLFNGGNSERGFARLDYHLGAREAFRVNLMAGRSSFQLANLRSQHANQQQQRQLLRDASASVGWMHTLNARSTFDVSASYRTSIAQLFPSAGDTPVTASQARHLSNITVGARFNRVQGAHNLRAGGDYFRFPLSENFSFGITNRSFNDPASEEFVPELLPFDLTRGGSLFWFSAKEAGNLYSGFVQDNITWKRFVLSLGARYDNYRFLVQGNQFQPRVGLSFHIRETGTVLRASYNRTYQTPPNENLLLSNSPASAALVPESTQQAVGGASLRIRPERQNVYEAGLQQAIGNRMSVNAAYYHKHSADLQDNDNFLNTGIIFPTSLKFLRVNGAELRTVFPAYRGFSGSLSLTHYHAVATPPFTGGLFIGSAAVDLLSAGPFVIDHDQKLGVHSLIEYRWKSFWTTCSLRYDSGLVSNPSDPDEVAQDPDYYDLLPYVNLTSDPPRVRPRLIADLAGGYGRSKEGRRRWDIQLGLFNLTNKVALYNFQSLFVGTRLVQPRSVGVKLRWYW